MLALADRTGVEADEIFMAPPAAGVSMTFKKKKKKKTGREVRECLRSVKRTDQQKRLIW